MKLDIIVVCIDREKDREYWLSQQAIFCALPFLNSIIVVEATKTHLITRRGKQSHPVSSHAIGDSHLRITREAFNKSFFMQIGAQLVSSDAIMFLDCDIRMSMSQLNSFFWYFAGIKGLAVVYLRSVLESDPRLSKSVNMGYMPVSVQDSNNSRRLKLVQWQGTGSRPGFGNIILTHQLYRDVGMHDLSYTQYGWEDLDLIARLILFGAKIYSAGEALHLSHPDSMRFLNHDSRQQSVANMREVFMHKFSCQLDL